MSTIRATYVQHGSSAVPNITLNASGQVIVASGIVSSGTFAAPSGSVSAPGIYFNGDSNTGLYSPAADTIAFTEGGVEALRIDSSGRVGIGTSSPADTSSFGGVLDLSGSQGGALYVRNQTSASKYGAFGFYDTDIYVTTYATGNIRFNTGSSGAERMRITSAGNVGIGTSTFSDARESLIVAPASGQTATFSIIKTGSTSANASLFFGDTDSNYSGGITYENATDAFAFRTNGSERFRCDSSGRLLVGTSTARTNFSNSTDDPQLQIESANGFGWASVRNSNTSGGAYVYIAKSRGTGNVILQNNDIIGGLNFEGNDGSEFVTAAQIRTEVDGTPGANDMPGRLVFSTTADGASSPTERMRITNSGEILIQKTSFNATTGVGIGYQPSSQQFSQVIDTNVNTYTLYNTSASAYRFYVNQAGTIFATSTTISAISDQRLKKNICDLDVGLDAILALKPRKFDWKEKSGNIGTNIRGFIAQEVEEVFPDLIDEWEKGENHPEGEDPYKSVRQDLIPVLVKAIQEQQAMIAELQAKVAALESA